MKNDGEKFDTMTIDDMAHSRQKWKNSSINKCGYKIISGVFLKLH